MRTDDVSKARSARKRLLRAGLMLAVMGVWAISGCASRTKALWNSRVGSHTFDQTVLELGPPDKTATLTDGTRVTEWRLRRGGYPSGTVTHFYGYPSMVWIEPGAPEVFLRLTFDPAGRLQSWRKIVR